MVRLSFLSLFALCLAMPGPETEAASELRRLVTLSRHGSRAPNTVVERICPKNHRNLHSYHVPFQQLTEVGMRQLVATGTHIRQVYVEEKGFLSSSLSGANNSHFQSYFRSDAATRCSQSATALGYGLYPDGSGPKGFSHQPLPVTMQLLPNEHDFAAPKGPCKPTLQKDLEVYGKTRAIELMNEYQEVLGRVAKACGVPLEEIPHMEGGEDIVLAVKDITDMLIFDQDEGLNPLPGVDAETSAQMKQLAFQHLMERYYSTDREITYWNGGFPMLLLKNLNDAANPTSPLPNSYRYFSYHGHRELLHGLGMMLGFHFNFTGLPSALGVSALHPATTMFFELHATTNEELKFEKYFVRTFVWSPFSDRQQVKLEKCSTWDCPLEEVNAIIANHIARTGTWQEICGYNPIKSDKVADLISDAGENWPTTSSGYLTIMGLALCLCTVFAGYKAILRIRNFRRSGYMPI